MFFHDDLDFYKNTNFRSFNFLEKAWEYIEKDFLFTIGLGNNFRFTISIDPGIIYIVATSNFETRVDKQYSLDFNHSINLCDDFSIEIDLNINVSRKNFCFETKKSKLYYLPNKKNDEGIVEFEAFAMFSYSTYKDFKTIFFLSIIKEIQFSINRNMFNLDIENYDSIIAEIDAEYELIRTYSILANKPLEKSIEHLAKEKLIFSENSSIISSLCSLLEE